MCSAKLGDPRLEKMEWCEVPEGEFLMGCTEEEVELILQEKKEFYQKQSWNYSPEDYQRWIQLARQALPQYSVFLPMFSIGKFAITNQEFHVFWRSGGYQEKKWWSTDGFAWLNRSSEDEEKMKLEKWRRRNGRTEPAFWNDSKLGIPNRPVVGVTWFEAMAYCAWLNEQLQLAGALPNGYVARLSTEAEWEKVARGTDGRFWPWGNEWKDNYANTRETNLLTSSSVRVFYTDMSQFGAFDVAGNVVEWCHSLLAPYPYSSRDGRENFNTDDWRVLRSSSWYLGKYAAHCAYRRSYPPDAHLDGLGFRVVIAPKLD
jgi:formylglycine-generating enzyme required for sulfatase activity